MANALNSNGMWFEALTKAWNDESFRQALLADARSAIETQLHVETLPRYATQLSADSRLPCIC